ncbi:MAG: sugar phosphate isomerase/epimerase [Ruminococcaceae bacterium]|nr:sugar phosphate isomerase/epimerase [Oscillospiraceae bacterium]
MKLMKSGMNIDAVKGISQKDYVRLMSELGFEATFSGDKDEAYHVSLANDLAEFGMEYETIHAPFDGINAMWGEDGEEMYKRLAHTIDMCALSGAGIAIIHLSSGVNAPTLNDMGMARYTRLVEYAAKKGVKIAFENQRKIANLSWALETFADAENVGFCWDCGHEYCFTPGREYMPLFANQLICTHIHDNTCVYNSDDHMIPFDGNVDFGRVAEHIRKAGFDGTLMLEVFAKHPMYEKMTPEAFLIRASEAVKRLERMVEA